MSYINCHLIQPLGNFCPALEETGGGDNAKRESDNELDQSAFEERTSVAEKLRAHRPALLGALKQCILHKGREVVPSHSSAMTAGARHKDSRQGNARKALRQEQEALATQGLLGRKGCPKVARRKAPSAAQEGALQGL